MPTTTLRSRRTGQGLAPGTCGELVQGTLPDGRRFHVALPIGRSAGFDVTLEPAAASRVSGLDPLEHKTLGAVRRALELLELGPCQVQLRRRAALPVAKGMASSTADIVAAARAIAAAAGQQLAPAELARLAAGIEATDAVMYDGIQAAELDTGRLLRRWSWWPEFAVAVVVPRASCRTDPARFMGQAADGRYYAALLGRLDAAVLARDAEAFALAGTESARRNERWLASPVLPALERVAAQVGALGLCVGHSGTVGGLLLPAGEDERAVAAAGLLRMAVPGAVEAFATRTPAWPAAPATATA